MGKRQKETKKKYHVQGSHIVQGIGMTIALSCVLVFIVAWMIGNGLLSEERSDWSVRTICFLSPFLVGMLQHKRFGGCAATEGILSALFSGIFLAGLGIIVWGEVSAEKGAWNILLFALGGGFVEILTQNKKKRRRN